MEVIGCLPPLSAIHQIIELRDPIFDRTARHMAEGYATVHAACRLLVENPFGKWQIDLPPIVDSFLHRPVTHVHPRIFQKTGWITH
jgi:hypothetical protein